MTSHGGINGLAVMHSVFFDEVLVEPLTCVRKGVNFFLTCAKVPLYCLYVIIEPT